MSNAPGQALTEQALLTVVSLAPLASIDLVIVDAERRVLVGRRVNEPAKGTWFVPGGRIRKGETLDEAFSRIARNELGLRKSRREDAHFVGAYTHLYETNFAEKDDVSTHYVVLAYLVEVDGELDQSACREQHSDYMWVALADLKDHEDERIHPNTVAYAADVERLLSGILDEDQYLIANMRKDAINARLWQTPALTLAGLAFVFTILLTTNSHQARWIAAALAGVISLASILLIRKHRFHEVKLSCDLQTYEEMHRLALLNRQIRPSSFPDSVSSVLIWQYLMGFLLVMALFAAVTLTIWPPYAAGHCTM